MAQLEWAYQTHHKPRGPKLSDVLPMEFEPYFAANIFVTSISVTRNSGICKGNFQKCPESIFLYYRNLPKNYIVLIFKLWEAEDTMNLYFFALGKMSSEVTWGQEAFDCLPINIGLACLCYVFWMQISTHQCIDIWAIYEIWIYVKITWCTCILHTCVRKIYPPEV